MASKLIPLSDRLVLRPIVQEEVLSSGIVIPDTAKEKSQEGEVVETGAGRVLENGSLVPIGVTQGDRILFGKFSGTEVRIADQDYLILREEEIFGVLTKTGKAAAKKVGAK